MQVQVDGNWYDMLGSGPSAIEAAPMPEPATAPMPGNEPVASAATLGQPAPQPVDPSGAAPPVPKPPPQGVGRSTRFRSLELYLARSGNTPPTVLYGLVPLSPGR